MSPEAPRARRKLPLFKLALAAGAAAVVAFLVLRGVDYRDLGQHGFSLHPRRRAVGLLLRGRDPSRLRRAAERLLPHGRGGLRAQMTMPGVIAAMLASIAVNLAFTYWLARYALHPLLSRVTEHYGYSIPQVTRENAVAVALVLRLTPGPPFFMQSYMLGLAHMPFRLYMVVSFLSVHPLDAGASSSSARGSSTGTSRWCSPALEPSSRPRRASTGCASAMPHALPEPDSQERREPPAVRHRVHTPGEGGARGVDRPLLGQGRGVQPARPAERARLFLAQGRRRPALGRHVPHAGRKADREAPRRAPGRGARGRRGLRGTGPVPACGEDARRRRRGGPAARIRGAQAPALRRGPLRRGEEEADPADAGDGGPPHVADGRRGPGLHADTHPAGMEGQGRRPARQRSRARGPPGRWPRCCASPSRSGSST